MAAAFEGSTRVERASDYLLSDENLLGAMLGRVPRLYPHTDQLAAAFEALRSQGHEVRALLVVREPVALVESCYRFLRGTSVVPGSIDGFVDSLELDSLRWTAVLDPLQRVLGADLHVVPFEWMARRPRRYRRALRGFHEAFAGLKLDVRHNASAPAAWLAISLAAQRAGFPLETEAFRHAGRVIGRRAALLGPPEPTAEGRAAWIAEARKALARAKVELPTPVIVAGLEGWLRTGAFEGRLRPGRARQIREAVADEWDELFARFMPGDDRRLWEPSPR
jgi:hypothetical protein